MAADNVLPHILWTKYFLDEKGCNVKGSTFFQDNLITMILEDKRKVSSGERTSYIETNLFFITNRIKAGDLRVKHKPTENMTTNFFTKPLQSEMFLKFRKEIMNK